MGRVSGKVAIVTGAAQGLGAEFARVLVAEGAKVVLTDILEQQGLAAAQALGDNACFLPQDVSVEDDWKRIISDAEASFGPVSVLVNNAAIAPYTAIENLEEAEYRRVIDVNQLSVFFALKNILPSMKRAGGGSIINISSVCGLIGSANMLAYTASKFAVRGMTKAAAIELAPHNIRVNSIHPALIRTPLMEVTEGEEIKSLIGNTPAGRIAEPAEVASIVLLLASDEARFSTGAEFVVDGGMTCQ